MITILLKKIINVLNTSFVSIISKLNSIKEKTAGGISPAGPTQYYLDDVWNGSIIKNEYVAADGSFVSYGGWDRTDYIDVHELQGQTIYLCGTIQSNGTYNGLYDENKNFINNFSTLPYVTIPANVYYIVISRQATIWGKIFRYINTEV